MQPRKPERLLRGIERCPVLPLVAREPRHQSVPWSRAPRLVRIAASTADCGPSLLAPRTAELWRRGASRAPGKRRLALHTAEDLPAGQKRQGRGLGECGWLDGRGQLFSKETGAALRLSGEWGGWHAATRRRRLPRRLPRRPVSTGAACCTRASSSSRDRRSAS